MSAQVAFDMFSSVTNDSNVNMTDVQLHADVNCSSTNISDPRCNKSESLLAPLSMMTLGITGNILALIIIYSARPDIQGRRTVFFVMLSGLAWTDVMAQICVSPIAILVYVNNLKWIGGAHLCRYHGYVMTSFGLVTPLIVCCMSIERYMAIRFSYFYAKHVTQRRAQVVFLMCILVPAVFSSFPFIGFGSYELQFPSSWCFLNFHRESTVDAIYAGFFSCINIAAILIMLFCNISVVVTLFNMRQSRKVNNSPSFDRRISVTQMSNGGGAVIRSRKHSDMEAQMIWFLCLITIAFSVCWLPFNVHILGNQFTGNTNHVLDLLFVRMVGCNQILDPWLYVIFRKSSFMRLLQYIKRILNLKRSPSDEMLNEALKKEGLRKRSLFRSSTMEVTTLNRTVNGQSRVVSNYMEDNLENLKKILESERKLGRDVYSRISERTEYSESIAQQDAGDCSRHTSSNQDCAYGSIRSRDHHPETMDQNEDVIKEGSTDDSEEDQIKYDDINIDAETLSIYPTLDDAPHSHRPCTYSRSCPIPGSQPLTSNPMDEIKEHHPISRQQSMITASSLHSYDQCHKSNAARLCPSPVHEANDPGSSADGNGDTHGSKSAASINSDRQGQGHRVSSNLNLDEGSESNDEVFANTDTEADMLFPGADSNGRSQSRTVSTPRVQNTSDNSTQNLQEGSASDSQGLLS